MRIHSDEGGPGQLRKRKGFFVRILEALHRSRRREAIRVLRRYRHLAAGQAQVRPAQQSKDIGKSSRNAHQDYTPARAHRRTGENRETWFA